MKIFPYMRTMSDPEKDSGVCMRLASENHLLNHYCVDKGRHVWGNFVLTETR